MSDIGMQALYQGHSVTIVDDIVYLPLLREIEWVSENGVRCSKWVKLYELELIDEVDNG